MALRATSLPLTFSNPTTLIPSNLQLWLDASDTTNMTVSSGNVSAWTDKSGTGNNATSPVGRNPSVATNTLNSRSVMTFSGSQNLTAAISLGGTTFTQFVVYSNSSVTVGQAYMDSSDGPVGKLCAQNGGGNQFQVGFAYGSTFQTGGAYRIVSTNCSNPGSSSTVSVWFNGTNQNIGSWNFYGASTTAITSVTIGARKDLIYFTGTIAEIIIYSTALTSPQQQTIEGYLAQKWGLTSSLPAGHPGLTTTIYTPIASGRRTFLEKIPYFLRFSPTQISGCSLWLDGADSSTITMVTGVSQWNDKSGNGYNLTQGSTGSQPTRTGNLLNFVTNYNMNIPQPAINNASTWSMFFAVNPIASVNWFMAKQRDGVNSYNIFSTTQTGGPGPNAYFTGLTNYLYVRMFNAGTLAASSVALTMSQLQILSFVYDGTNMLIYINGNLSSTTAGSFAIQNDTSSTNFLLGQWFGNGTNYNSNGNFQLGELIYFNTAITATNRQQVESYLAQKWGLVSYLPATNHIHNTFPAGSPPAIQPFISSVTTPVIKFISYPTGTPTVNTPTNTATTLNMTWNAPTFTTTWNGREVSQVLITSYTVYVLADGSLATTLTPGNVLSTTFSPMTAGVAYSFYVRANGPGGTSGASATSSTVTYILPPQAPTVNTPTNTVTTLNMTWNAPVGGGQVTGYTVYVLAAGSLASTLSLGNVLSTTFSPMTGDVAYSFYVSATGPGGTSSASSTSATVTYSAGPMSYLTGVNIYMSTSTTDWTNNWKPYLNAVFSCNSVSNITTTYNKIGISNWAGTNTWQLGVVHPNSNIYFSPYNAANILCYNPFTSNQTFITGGPNSTASYTGTAKWNNGCLAPNGMIYFFPWTAATILGLNPDTNDTCNISLAGRGGTYTSSGYRNSILARDGRIYLSPYGATSIFWFNPSNFSTGNITSAAGVNLPGSSVRWEGTSFGADGNIYMNPLTGAQPVLRLNLSNYSTDTINAGLTAGQTFRGAATLSVNDSLYFAPAQANAGILYVNSNLTTGIIANTTALVYRDSFYGPDGKIYIMPNNGSATVMVVNPSNNTVTNSNNSLTSVNIQGAVMGLDGNIYGGTQTNSNLLQVVFNNVAYKFDSNYILSPYVNHH